MNASDPTKETRGWGRGMASPLRCLVLAFGVLLGCAPDLPPPSGGAYLAFDEVSAADIEAALSIDPPTTTPEAELRPDQQQALERIVADPSAFFARRPPTPVLNEAELVFAAGGRLFELTGLYGEAVERGVTELRPRLAWMLERIGLHGRALAESQQAIDEHPDDAEAWFVRGYVLGQSDEASTELLRAIRDAYERAYTLDPEFLGPSDVTAAELRAQVQQIDASLGGP